MTSRFEYDTQLLKNLNPKDWHGYSIGESALHIGPYWYRKSIALSTVDGCVSQPRAYFRSEDDAWATLALLDKLMNRKTLR